MYRKIQLAISLCSVLSLNAAFSQAMMDFRETTFDFGEIAEGTVAQHEFVFTNTGDQPLVISSVKASCGCTTPSWTKEPVLPGKSGHIKASYNSANRPGGFHKSITITSNATKPTQVLYIKGSAVKSSALTPLFTAEELANSAKVEIRQSHIQLGKVQIGSSIPVKLLVNNSGKTALEIKGVQSSCGCLSLIPGENMVVEPNSQGKVELVFAAKTLGEHTYGAYILSNDLAQPKHQFYVTSSVVPRAEQSSVVQETPSKISF